MPVRGQRLARLLKLIALLRGPTCWHARKLAEHFGTSRRNVHRDLSVLRLAGVPVFRDAEFGETGSYRISREWYFPHVGLTDEECVNLSVLTRAAETESIPLLTGACEVRDKLLSTLPAKQQDLIRDAAELFEVLSLGMANHAHCTKIMVNIQAALLQRRKIQAVYRSPQGKKTKPVKLQPRRVFLTRQSWYLAAYDEVARKDKLYRLPRFQEVRLLTEPMNVPTDWSLQDMLGHAWGVMKGERDFHVELLFDAWAAELVGEVRWHQTQELIPQKDGKLIFRATVAGLDELRWWVLGWGPHVVVQKPKELAKEIQTLARDTLRNYEDGGQTVGRSGTNRHE